MKNVCHKHGPTESSICEKCLPNETYFKPQPTPSANERSEHTPGPCVHGIGSDYRCKKCDNTRITVAMVAAPDLLEALKGLFNEYLRAREMINEKASETVSKEEARDAVRIKRAIRELIAKAEGRI